MDGKYDTSNSMSKALYLDSDLEKNRLKKEKGFTYLSATSTGQCL